MRRKEKEFMNVEEAANFLGVPLSTFRKLVAQRYKNIPCFKLGRRFVFKRNLLESWAENLILSDFSWRINKMKTAHIKRKKSMLSRHALNEIFDSEAFCGHLVGFLR